MILQYINWDVAPEIIKIGDFQIRWYGLMFFFAFMLGHYIMNKIFKIEGKSEKDLEILTMFMLVSTIVGARLGHCLFYEPDYYLSHPIEILKVWKGGLASHGAAVGIIAGLYLFSQKRKISWLWILDRTVIVVALAGMFIRFGNLMNSEIIGDKTDVPWAFIFKRVDQFPRHPAQLYEALFYFLTFVILYRMYMAKKTKIEEGKLFGYFLVLVFGFRFFIEFLKEVQVQAETTMTLNIGQKLSIPFVAIGVFFILRARKKAVS